MSDFEPFSFFQIILKHINVARGEQAIKIDCLQRFLDSNNIRSHQLLISNDHWQQLLRLQFQTLNSDQISYTEFLRIILPVKKKKLREKVLKKQRINQEEPNISPIVRSKILFAIAQVIDTTIKMHASLSEYRHALNASCGKNQYIQEKDILKMFQIGSGGSLDK